MVKKLHTKTKIFFPNPYVLRLEHKDKVFINVPVSYKNALNSARKSLSGTWGFSEPQIEINYHDNSPINTNMSWWRSYWCFADKLDAMQFRLIIDPDSMHVSMWPETWFTITEII